MSSTFAQLGVPSFIQQGLAKRGIERPFDIQAATIEDALAGRDLCGRAPTGSGKTLAFGIPLVANISPAQPKRPHGLVLAPTRELADQIAQEIRSFAGRSRVGVVYGGVGYPAQERALRQGVEILVACPGRLEDLIARGTVDLGSTEVVVIDEADRLADMGFLPAVRRILDQTPTERQTVLFSATLDGEVAKLTKSYQRNPVRHEVGDSSPDITSAEHRFLQVERTERVDAAADIVRGVYQTIVFCRTRHGSDRLAKQLRSRGVTADSIHGGHAQNRRTRTLDKFTKGDLQALIATDVAARGIHIDRLDAVIHFDPPEDHKAYIHRSGRTARAGEGGLVVSLLLPEQVNDAQRMARILGLDSTINTPDGEIAATPSTSTSGHDGRNSNGGGGRGRGGGNNGRRNAGGRNGEGRAGESRGGESRAGEGRGRSSRSGQPRAKNRTKSGAKNSANGNGASGGGNGENRGGSGKNRRRRNARRKPSGSPS